MHDSPLSRRERQIMDIVYLARGGGYGCGKHTVPSRQICLSYSAVRALLRILLDKGHLQHDQDGPRDRCTPRRFPRRKRGRLCWPRWFVPSSAGSPIQAVFGPARFFARTALKG